MAAFELQLASVGLIEVWTLDDLVVEYISLLREFILHFYFMSLQLSFHFPHHLAMWESAI